MQSLFHCDHINLSFAAFGKRNQAKSTKKPQTNHQWVSFFHHLPTSKIDTDSVQTLISISADVLSEEAILKWYKEAHVAKGKSVFLDQMKKFVEWLQNAEEGMDMFKEIW